MQWADVVEHLTGMAHLATVTADGSPHVAMVAPTVDGDLIWIGTRLSSVKARNIATKPKVALMWTPRAEAYVSGDAELVTAIDEKRRVWESGIFPYDMAMFFGSADDDDFVFVKVQPRRATVLSQSDAGIQRRTWRH